jgi:hypothetical protein
MASAITQKFLAVYEVSATVDTNRNTEAAAAVKALKSALWLVGGSLSAGTLTDEVSFGDTQYRIRTRSDASTILKMATSAANISRQSDGRRLASGRPYSDRFVEKKGTKEPVVVTLDYGRKLATYMRGKELRKQEPLGNSVADSAVLPYIFFRQPRPTGPALILATDGISTRQLMLDQADTTVEVAGRSLAAVKWTRRLSNAQDPSLELWVRKEDGFPLRMRLGLNARYGAVLEQRLAKLPQFVNTP